MGTPARFDPLDVTKEESLAAVGVGKLEVLEFRDALAVAGQGEGRLACNQVLYHLQQRAIEGDVQHCPAYRSHPAIYCLSLFHPYAATRRWR